MRACVCLMVTLTGCGGGSAELTCELLADPHNCWAEAAAAAAACTPSTPGTLSADRTTCTFAGGATVVFDAPLATDPLALDHLKFTAHGPGCDWAFFDTFHNRMELTVGGRTEVAELHPDRTFELACSDGSSFEAGFDLLFTCQPPARAPTDGFDVSADGIEMSISAVGVRTPLFSCLTSAPPAR